MRERKGENMKRTRSRRKPKVGYAQPMAGHAHLWWPVLALVVLTGCPQKKPSPCRNPEYVDVMKEQAMNYLGKGKYIEALKSASKAEECKPDDPELYKIIGLTYYKRDKMYDAIANYKKSIEIDPEYMESRMALAIVYLDLQNWDQAIEQLEVVASDDYFERPWVAYNNMGWAYFKKGDLAMARVNLKRALKINPNFCPAYCNLGELEAKQKNQRAAVTNYNKAISLCPENYARPRFLLGVEYARMELYSKACDQFAAAAHIKNAPEAQQALDYMRMYDCPGVLKMPPRR